jgi:hypothetical protein
MKNTLFLLLSFGFFTATAQQQQRSNPPQTFQDFQREMEAMQRRLFQGWDQGFQGFSQDTSFHFEMDSLGNGFSFHSRIFGDTTGLRSNFFDFKSFDQLFEQMFDQPADGSGNMWFGFPEQPDDLDKNDGLTPEERLREEERGVPEKGRGATKSKPVESKPKIKSIRI